MSLSPHSVGWLVVANKSLTGGSHSELTLGQIYEIEAVIKHPMHYAYRLKGVATPADQAYLTPLQSLDPIFSFPEQRIAPGDPVCVTNEVKGIEVGLHRVISLHWDLDNGSGVWLRLADGVIRWTEVIPLDPSDEEGEIGLQYLINAYRQANRLVGQHPPAHPLHTDMTALRHNIRGAIQELASS